MAGLGGAAMPRRPLLKRPNNLRADVSNGQFTHRLCPQRCAFIGCNVLSRRLAFVLLVARRLARSTSVSSPATSLSQSAVPTRRASAALAAHAAPYCLQLLKLRFD